jgi:hypothetical protein
MRPKDFWNLHPKEFWWLYAHHTRERAAVNYAGMTEEEVERIYFETYGEPPFQDA